MVKRILYNLLENDRSVAFILYNTFSFSLLFVSVILGLYDEFYGFHTQLHPIILNIEYFVSGIIAFELVGRFILAENKKAYLINPLTIMDFIAVIPYFHIFRTVRLVVLIARLLRLTYRYRFFLEFFAKVFREVYYEILFVLGIFFVIIFSILLIMFSLEHGAGNPGVKSFFDAVYLVIITATTVGYGDITPITHAGKVFAMVLGIMGLFLFSLLSATVSTGFFHYVNMLKTGMLSFREMKNHIVICGWNETGEVIVEELKRYYREKGEKVKTIIVITEQELTPEDTFYYKKGDFVKEDVLKNAGVEQAEMVIILAEKSVNLTEDSIDARSILTAMLVRDLNPKAKIIVEVLMRENAKTLRRKKIADYIIVDGEIVGSIISKIIKKERATEIFEFLMDKVDYVEQEATEELTVEEILRSLEKGMSLVGVKRGEELIMFPDLDFEVKPGDTLLLIKKKYFP